MEAFERSGGRVLSLVVGRAGTGKTHRCLESVARELVGGGAWSGAPLLLLVPEQATAQTERALLERLGGAGAAYARAHVLSFHRLAHRVLEETGGAPRPALNVLGKRMILRRVLDDIDARHGFFGASASRPGFVEVIQRTLDELRRYRVEPDALRETALGARRSGEARLAEKLEAIAGIATAFRTRIESQFTDPEDLLSLAARKMGHASLLRGAWVWIDGFVGFTPQEYALLEALFAAAGPVEAALCLDPELAPGAAALSTFEPTARTYARLLQAAARSARRTETFFLREPRRYRADAPLGRLERWCAEPRSAATAAGAEGIVFVEAADRRGEAEAAAVECLRLHRDEGCRFHDIAVLARDLDPYADLITAAFREFGVPFFIDRRRSLAHHPLAELLRSALDVIAGGWEPSRVFRYLRTDLSVPPERRDDVDRLEKHVQAHGSRGDDFIRKASRGRKARPGARNGGEEQDDAALGAFCRDAFGPLRRLQEALSGREALTARFITERLDALLAELGVAATLQSWSERGRSAVEGAGQVEDAEAAAGHRQAWSGVIDLFDQIVAVLGEAPITLDAYAEALDAGLDALSEALPPPSLEQVLVGSVERSRHPELRAAFVLGLNERVFPLVRAEDPVLRDTDRRRLAGEGIELAPTSETELRHERYYFYIAATRARERVIVSRARMDEMGRSLAPSPIWPDLLRAFPSAERRSWPGPPHEGGVTPARLAGGAAAALRSESEEERRRGEAAYARMLALPAFRRALDLVMPSLDPPFAEGIAPASARALYGETLELSASNLEAFGACPFQHFARHGLRLEEPAALDLQPSDVGRLCHEALRGFADAMFGREGWSRAPREDLQAALDAAFDRAAAEMRDVEFLSSPRRAERLLLLKRELGMFVEYLAHRCARSEFAPRAAELTFGMDGSGLPALEIPLGDGRQVVLKGKIDRVDVAEGEEGLLVFAHDYKSSAHKVSAIEAAEGVDLQILVYLLALERAGRERFGAEILPAGAAYQLMRLGLLDPESCEQAPRAGTPQFRESLAKKFELHGLGDARWVGKEALGRRATANLIAPGALPAVLAYVESRIAAFARRILDGDCGVSPYHDGSENGAACARCAFGDVCGYDRRLHAPRRPQSATQAEAWQRMITQGAEAAEESARAIAKAGEGE